MSKILKAALVLIPTDENGKDLISDIQVVDLLSIVKNNDQEYIIKTKPFNDSCINLSFMRKD